MSIKFDIMETQHQPSYMDEHEAFAASRSSEHVYVPIDDRNFTTLDKHAETIEMDARLPLVSIFTEKRLCIMFSWIIQANNWWFDSVW